MNFRYKLIILCTKIKIQDFVNNSGMIYNDFKSTHQYFDVIIICNVNLTDYN